MPIRRRYRVPASKPRTPHDARDLIDRHTFVVSPNEVDDRLIETFSGFGPGRRLRPRLGLAITDALKIARARAKRGSFRAVGVYECKPYSETAHESGCAIVGYTTTDEHDHIRFTRY